MKNENIMMKTIIDTQHICLTDFEERIGQIMQHFLLTH